jgi:hypothetical protein
MSTTLSEIVEGKTPEFGATVGLGASWRDATEGGRRTTPATTTGGLGSA